jgi:hypothetical protein
MENKQEERKKIENFIEKFIKNAEKIELKLWNFARLNRSLWNFIKEMLIEVELNRNPLKVQEKSIRNRKKKFFFVKIKSSECSC